MYDDDGVFVYNGCGVRRSTADWRLHGGSGEPVYCPERTHVHGRLYILE